MAVLKTVYAAPVDEQVALDTLEIFGECWDKSIRKFFSLGWIPGSI